MFTYKKTVQHCCWLILTSTFFGSLIGGEKAADVIVVLNNNKTIDLNLKPELINSLQASEAAGFAVMERTWGIGSLIAACNNVAGSQIISTNAKNQLNHYNISKTRQSKSMRATFDKKIFNDVHSLDVGTDGAVGILVSLKQTGRKIFQMRVGTKTLNPVTETRIKAVAVGNQNSLAYLQENNDFIGFIQDKQFSLNLNPLNSPKTEDMALQSFAMGGDSTVWCLSQDGTQLTMLEMPIELLANNSSPTNTMNYQVNTFFTQTLIPVPPAMPKIVAMAAKGTAGQFYMILLTENDFIFIRDENGDWYKTAGPIPQIKHIAIDNKGTASFRLVSHNISGGYILRAFKDTWQSKMSKEYTAPVAAPTVQNSETLLNEIKTATNIDVAISKAITFINLTNPAPSMQNLAELANTLDQVLKKFSSQDAAPKKILSFIGNNFNKLGDNPAWAILIKSSQMSLIGAIKDLNTAMTGLGELVAMKEQTQIKGAELQALLNLLNQYFERSGPTDKQNFITWFEGFFKNEQHAIFLFNEISAWWNFLIKLGLQDNFFMVEQLNAAIAELQAFNFNDRLPEGMMGIPENAPVFRFGQIVRKGLDACGKNMFALNKFLAEFVKKLSPLTIEERGKYASEVALGSWAEALNPLFKNSRQPWDWLVQEAQLNEINRLETVITDLRKEIVSLQQGSVKDRLGVLVDQQLSPAPAPTIPPVSEPTMPAPMPAPTPEIPPINSPTPKLVDVPAAPTLIIEPMPIPSLTTTQAPQSDLIQPTAAAIPAA